MDFAHGRPVAGSARALRQVPDSPSPLPEPGAFGSHGKSAAGHRADLLERGGLDLRECFIDGTFVPAKKGLQFGRPNAAKAPKSWVWPTAMVFLSPCAQPVLRRLK